MPGPRDRSLLLLDPVDASPDTAALSTAAPDLPLAAAGDVRSFLALLPAADVAVVVARDDLVIAHDALRSGRAAAPAVPVIVVAPRAGAREVVDLLRAGARDIVLDPDAELAGCIAAARATRAAEDAVQSQLAALREDEEAGRRVQLRILPESPREIAGCRVSHRVEPSLYLSGDFIDYFEVAPGCVAFYLADVSGHGASSAFVTLLLKTVGNRARRELQRDPANLRRPSLLLDRINRELLSLGLGKHVAMLAGIVDRGRRELYFAVGGQYPQLIVSDGKCARYASGTGMPVGLFEDALYEDRIHALPEGFTLVLMSDGVFELMGPDSLADKEARLLDIVGPGTPDVDALALALGLDAARDLPDDVALLVIHEAAVDTGA